ncbi:MAG TPA: (2Fe-2S)-binding protein [Acidobacteriaceae bacterium]|jgi:sarcosine oxidase subunit alpha|nr:(2Fe-2S)-binding protein [Acidobacteriaceae bacterium]
MSELVQSVSLIVNGALLSVASGTTVAAAVLMAGTMTRASVAGEPRGPLCGMGICFECRVTIDGVAHQRSCQILCTEGLRVTTPDGGSIQQLWGDGTP